MAILLSQRFSMFLVDGGIDKLTPKSLLNFKHPKMQLGKKDIFVGGRVRSFIKKMGLSCDSPVLAEFFNSVTKYYHESTTRLIKYFKTPLFTDSYLILLSLIPKIVK